MITPRRSIFPISLQTTVTLIGQLDERAFHALKDDLRGPMGFDSDARRLTRLAEAMDVDIDGTRAIVQAVGYMYDQIHRTPSETVSEEDIRDVLENDLHMSADPDVEPLRGRLLDLLSRDEEIETYRRRRDLKNGSTRRAVDFSSTLDLRPDFGEAGASLVPLTQFRVVTDAAEGTVEPIVFQLDARALERLEDAVRDARARLRALRDDPVIGRTVAD